MRKVNVLILALALAASGALAACPDNVGIWSSNPETNPDFPLLNGRVSEAWCGANGNPVAAGQPGNTQNAQSWNGASMELGVEWRIWGMAIDENGPALLFDGVSGGNGVRIYETNYDGGEFWLGGDGAWTAGDVELTGTIFNYQVTTTITYVGGEIAAQVSNVTFNGAFGDCPEDNGCVIEFAIANAALVWRSDSGDPMPMNYPEFLCNADSGELFTTSDITLGINCAVAVEASTLSEIKGMYR
jgi:hypothetical protein